MFNKRSEQKELLDNENIPVADLHRNLYELDVINRKLGGHSVTINALKGLKLLKDKTYRILDIGSGGGDTLKAIAAWAGHEGYQLELVGVDVKEDCISYAENFCKPFSNISFILSDYKVVLNEGFDIIITSLFCHHLSNNELVDLFTKCSSNARVAFVVNDLHRNLFAYYPIALLTKFFSRSYLVKNDAKLSVLRGFSRNDLQSVINRSGLDQKDVSIKWRWAFRWLIIIKPADL